MGDGEVNFGEMLGVEGGDTEGRNETVLIDGTYELRKKKR